MPARTCLVLVLAAFGIGCQERQPLPPASVPHACADFLSRTDFDVSVMDAELMDAGTDTEYCWVDAMIRPNIRFGASLPADWNGRLVMRGGGGYAGQQPVKGGDDPLRDQGHVTASTDTGHDAARYPLASFAYNNRDGEIDYAYRAVHLTAVAVKELVAEHYGRPADYDYWLGYRLFMVPGMFHCAGGRGVNRVDAFPDLVEWVETGAAPDRLLGERVDRDGEVLMTRPVCPYPAAARYTGAGDVAAAASFECRLPEASAVR